MLNQDQNNILGLQEVHGMLLAGPQVEARRGLSDREEPPPPCMASTLPPGSIGTFVHSTLCGLYWLYYMRDAFVHGGSKMHVARMKDVRGNQTSTSAQLAGLGCPRGQG